MRRSGVRIPLAPPHTDIRSGCRFFASSGVVAAGVPGAARAVLWARLLGVPVDGCPPARRQRRELRSVRRLEARPGPATAHRHRSLAPPPPSTSAAPAVLCVVRRLEPGQAPPPPTGAASNSHETVIAFAGVCAVSGETDE